MIPDELKRCHRLEGEESLSQYRESEYMGAEDFDPGAEPVLTIKALYNGQVTLSDGKQNKSIIEFVENTAPGIKNVRPMIVNRDRREALKRLYKSTMAKDLEGKRIKLYVIPDGTRNKKGERVDWIRIRPEIPRDTTPACEECGQILTAYGKMSAVQLAAYTKEKFGRCLCMDCGKKLSGQEKTEQTSAENSGPHGDGQPHGDK